MGNRSSAQQQYAYNPALNGWEIKQKGDEFNVWRHSQTGEEIEEYRRVFNDKRHFDYQRDMFEYRHNSDFLVSSKFFREESQRDMCSTFYKGNIYLERIPLRLQQLNEIPYPDVLHLYHQAFRGFAKLFDKVGYFEPIDSLICINQQRRVKIWLNENLASSIPETVFGDVERTEANMVRNVINTIQASTAISTLPENILNTMRSNAVSTFRDADNVLQDIATRHGIAIPTQLNCIFDMHPQLLTRVTTDAGVTRIPGISVIPGAPIYHQSSILPVGVSPSSPVFHSTLNRNIPVSVNQSFAPPNVHVNNINLPIQTQIITTKPASAINSGPRMNVNPLSVSAFKIRNINKPLSGNAPTQATRIVNQSNLEGRATMGAVGRALPGHAMSVIPEACRVSPVVTRKNVSLVEETQSSNTFARNINNRKALQSNQNIQIKLQNPNTTGIGAAISATNTSVNTSIHNTKTGRHNLKTGGHNIKTIYEVQSNKLGLSNKPIIDFKSKGTDVNSSEINTSLGIKLFEERKPSKTDYTSSESYKKDEFTLTNTQTPSLAYPITHTSPSFSKDFKVETEYTTSLLNDNYTYGKYSSENVKNSLGSLTNTPTYDYFKSLNTNIPSSVSPKVEFTYSSTYIPLSSLSNPIDSFGINNTYQSSKVQYSTLYGGITPLSTTGLLDKYKSYETEIIDYSVGSRTAGLGNTTTLGGYHHIGEKISNEFDSYQMKYSYVEHGTDKTSFDYTTTEEVYRVTESYMPATTNYGAITAHSYTNTAPISYSGLSTSKHEESYNVSMDNQLLRDLERMRSGGIPIAPAAAEFISTVSFGANSEYIRDSIKSGFSH